MCAGTLTGPVGTERIAALAGEGEGEAGPEADKTEMTPAMDGTVVSSDVALKVSIDETGSTWMLISR